MSVSSLRKTLGIENKELEIEFVSQLANHNRA